MIIEKEIVVMPNSAMKKHLQSLGYTLDRRIPLTIRVEHLPPSSNRNVRCICDVCGRQYDQRFSRDTNVCGACKTKSRMRGNKLGSRKRTHPIPPKEELDGLGKQAIAKKFKVSIPTVNGWLRHHNIDLPPYYGLLIHKTGEEIQKTIDTLSTQFDGNLSLLSRKTGISVHTIKSLRKKNLLTLKTKFDIWENRYEAILKKMDFYIEENQTKTLQTISEENLISIEQLKKAFREMGVRVKLHSVTKSRGEIECRDFIRALGEDCFSAMLEKTFEIDCFVPKKNFGVEYCGEYWHRYVPSKKNKFYHRDKYDLAQKQGISLLTIFESEWRTKPRIVKSMISSRLGYNQTVGGRGCEVREINKDEARIFHEANHLSGYTASGLNYGLLKDGVLLSCLSMIRSRFDKEYEWEIARFSTLCGYTVVGGLGKMFGYFRNTQNPKSCMTYVDLRVGSGGSYEKIGFSFLGRTPPNYYYYHKDRGVLESRMKYQKNKLRGFPEYSILKTEQEIMEDSGFYRIYNCGNNKFGWKASYP